MPAVAHLNRICLVNLEFRTITCPYCWAGFETSIDCSGGDQDYFDDCPVCCNPVRFLIQVDTDGELVSLDALREDE